MNKLIKNQGGLVQIIVVILFLGLIATLYLVQQNTNTLPKAFEASHLHNSTVTVFDAGIASPNPEVIQKEFTSKDELVKKLLEDSDTSNGTLLDVILNRYLTHGEKVIDILIQTWSNWGFYIAEIPLIPLQNIFSKEDLELVEDDLGNPGISLNFNSDKIIELLKKDTSKVVNMSFQVGKVEAYLEKKYRDVPDPKIPLANYEHNKEGEDINPERVYLLPPEGAYYTNAEDVNVPFSFADKQPLTPISGEEYLVLIQQKKNEAEANARIVDLHYPSTKIVGAYIKEKANENLSKLFEICEAYPDKLFVVAAGNDKEDIREALDELSYQKPNNLLTVAEWGSIRNSGPENRVYGADIYVDNYSLELPSGSTYSTPVVAARASVLFAMEYSLAEVKQHILDESALQGYAIDGVKQKARIFNPKELK